MNHMAQGAAAVVVAAVLAGCTSTPGYETDMDASSLMLNTLSTSVAQKGLEMYGGAAGAGGRNRACESKSH